MSKVVHQDRRVFAMVLYIYTRGECAKVLSICTR